MFRITPSGTLTTLYSFNPPNPTAMPSGMVQGSDGNFYGTTFTGGTNNQGMIFKLTPDGTLTTLYSFSGPDGQDPNGLIQGTDGNFYGTTQAGGDLSCGSGGGCGTVFRITASGVMTTLHSFSGPDGSVPIAVLVQSTDGNFYGTTSGGGASQNCQAYGCGTVFRITASGVLTTLYNFAGAASSDGMFPAAPLMQATDGNFYGTTLNGGEHNAGSAFRITPAGTLVILYNFCSASQCTDGRSPWGGLLEGANGLLYGTTSFGGTVNCNNPNGCGTVFSLPGVNPGH